MKRRYVIGALFLLLSIILIVYNKQEKPVSPQVTSNQTPQSLEITNTPQREVVASGIKRPHGIGFHNGTIYVSSETDKVLYKIKDGKTERFVDLNFPHDMIFEADGSIVTPVFYENRVVRIKPDGTVTTLYSGFDGPNGIAYNKFGNIYVSNYNNSRVLTTRDNTTFTDMTVRTLDGYAGLAYDTERNFLWIAGYTGNSISGYGLGDKDASIKRQRTFYTKLEGVTHPESIKIKDGATNTLLVTAVKNGKGVIIETNHLGQYKVILETDLPDPLVGYFTDDGYVYLVSPNDSQGRILKAKIN